MNGNILFPANLSVLANRKFRLVFSFKFQGEFDKIVWENIVHRKWGHRKSPLWRKSPIIITQPTPHPTPPSCFTMSPFSMFSHTMLSSFPKFHTKTNISVMVNHYLPCYTLIFTNCLDIKLISGQIFFCDKLINSTIISRSNTFLALFWPFFLNFQDLDYDMNKIENVFWKP